MKNTRIKQSFLPEGCPFLNRTLSDIRYTVVVLITLLEDSVPMDGSLHSLHVIFNVDDNFVTFAYLYTRSWYHPVSCKNSTLNTVSQYTLAVTRDRVCWIRSANLAGPVKNKVSCKFEKKKITINLPSKNRIKF